MVYLSLCLVYANWVAQARSEEKKSVFALRGANTNNQKQEYLFIDIYLTIFFLFALLALDCRPCRLMCPIRCFPSCYLRFGVWLSLSSSLPLFSMLQAPPPQPPEMKWNADNLHIKWYLIKAQKKQNRRRRRSSKNPARILLLLIVIYVFGLCAVASVYPYYMCLNINTNEWRITRSP